VDRARGVVDGASKGVDAETVALPVLIGGTMGTESWVLVGTREGAELAFGSACGYVAFGPL
jgi:RNA-splicing ligase RtcB